MPGRCNGGISGIEAGAETDQMHVGTFVRKN